MRPEEIAQENAEDHERDASVETVPLKGEGGNGENDPGHRGQDQQQQAQLDDATALVAPRGAQNTAERAQMSRLSQERAVVRGAPAALMQIEDSPLRTIAEAVMTPIRSRRLIIPSIRSSVRPA